MAGGLIYGNQVGAPKGLNQSAPGTFILDEYLRWGQDVLFDRAGLYSSSCSVYCAFFV
jgi:hypothetical protein